MLYEKPEFGKAENFVYRKCIVYRFCAFVYIPLDIEKASYYTRILFEINVIYKNLKVLSKPKHSKIVNYFYITIKNLQYF